MSTLLPETDLPVLVVPAAATIPAGNPTAPDWTALVGRVTALEGLGLVDLRDVSTTGLANGLTLVYHSASGTWRPGSLTGSIATLRDHTGAVVAESVSDLTARLGLTAVITTGNNVAFQVNFDGTGAANTVARSDHVHPQPLSQPFAIAAGGDLSSGTRTLVSGNVTGLSSDRSYTLTARLIFDVRGAGTGAGYGTARIILDGNVSARPEARVVSGVPQELTWEHDGVVVSGVTSVAVSATFQHNGASDPISMGAGKLSVTPKPYR